MNKSDAGKLGYSKAKIIFNKLYLDRIKDYESKPKKCKFCGKSLSYAKRRNIFCTHSCSQSYNNTGKRRHGKEPGNCPVCNKKLSRSYKKYCSHYCENIYKWNKYVDFVEKEGKFPLKTARTGDIFFRPKKYLIQKFGHKCSICGIEKWQGVPVPIVLDHIDGNPMNWEINNCRLVCRNCDGLLPTFCSKNKNSGNSDRYKWRKAKKVN
jgi:hypothetical protein